jgi:hypothetical protein
MSTPRQLAPLYRSEAFRGHETGSHPENPRRLDGIVRELERQGLLADRPEVAFGPATREQLTRVHDERYLDLLERIVEAGGGWIDADTYCGPDSLEVARLAAGAVVAAVDGALNGTHARAFTLGRPPGHHALGARAMGFCLLGNVAVGAAHALAHGLERVASVGVEPSRDEDQLRLEPLDRGCEQPLESLQRIGVACAGTERRIEREAGSAPHARLRRRPGAGEEAAAVAVHRAEEHTVGVVEHLLGAVAVVDVPVDDRDPLEAMRQRVRRADGDVAE